MNFPPEDVHAQLDRILASPGFASADRASRFLRYVVERTLAGEGDQLKEYVIGRAVFDRTDDYDPRIDSIVRVEAGRLRSKVDEYYSGPGRQDGILIQLRRGSYAPEFEPRGRETVVAPVVGGLEPADQIARSNSKRNLLLAAAGVVAVALAAWSAATWATSDRMSPGQTIAVLPFSNYSMDPTERMLAARITDGITAELARLGTIGVVSHTSALQYEDIRPRPALKEIAAALNAQFILEGKVRDEAGQIRIQVVLVDSAIDRKIWVHDVGGTASDIPEMQRQIAKAASTEVLKRKR